MSRILCVGYSQKNVQERTQALVRAGYEVVATTDARAAETEAGTSQLDLIVLGYTLGSAERNRIATRARARNPRVRIVMLYRGSIQNAELADALLGIASAEALVETVRLLLRQNEKHAQSSGAG